MTQLSCQPVEQPERGSNAEKEHATATIPNESGDRLSHLSHETEKNMPTPTPIRLLIASDHAAIDLKARLQVLFAQDTKGHLVEWVDLGPQAGSGSVDYPDYAEKLGRQLTADPSFRGGVLLCGSGIGVSIAANKIPGIRAALCENPVSARLAREHNHANVLCMGARFVAPEYAVEILRAWLEATPSSDARHCGRIEKMKKLETT